MEAAQEPWVWVERPMTVSVLQQPEMKQEMRLEYETGGPDKERDQPRQNVTMNLMCAVYMPTSTEHEYSLSSVSPRPTNSIGGLPRGLSSSGFGQAFFHRVEPFAPKSHVAANFTMPLLYVVQVNINAHLVWKCN
ncbi:hypothetical protein PG985_006633 [Apiospora marii]|uniref:uncharacterized protein n=1 Tax=Apiospora marii TaxID=335849 RepID=UPI0031314535